MGSARSINGFNIYKALQECESCLEKYGGHSQAAGMTIRSENFDLFSTTFEEVARYRLKEEDLREAIEVYDAARIWQGDDSGFWDYFKQMEPFGAGNPEPIFAAFACQLRDMRIVGERHLRFFLCLNGLKPVPGIAFNRGGLLPHLRDRKVDIAFTLRLNQFRGEENWQACMVDVGSEVIT